MRSLVVLAALVVLAGCIGKPEIQATSEEIAPAALPAAMAPSSAPSTGSLVVTARMPDLTPLPGTSIALGNLTLETDASGIARFDALAPGIVNVTARKEAHRTAQLEAKIVAGETTQVDAILAALVEGDQHSHEDGLLAHRDLYAFDGHFDCSATYVVITGDCMLIVDNVTTTAGLSAPADPTTERNVIDFPLDRSWSALIVEMTWTSSAPTPATGSSMSLALEPAEAPADGHAAKYARVVGEAPLRVELAPGAPHETATAEDMPHPDGGEVIRARAYVAGLAQRPAGTDYLGVGVAKDQKFTITVTIVYGGA